jgi:Reverse transcriptase (RNA-dependent DNA polymerase)
MGLSTAPHFFQKTIRAIVEIGRETYVVVYLDDICVHGPDVNETWVRTVEVLQALTTAGYMINITKSVFLRDEITILGYQM